MRHRTLTALAFLLAACGSTRTDAPVASASWAPPRATSETDLRHEFQPDLEISHSPFREVHTNWKQRLDQPYVYVEYVGSYVETGRLLPMVQQAMLEQGFLPSGAPFCLFYDDPGAVPSDQLRSRACVPVEGAVEPVGTLAYDVLPSTTVVYAFASGAYPDVPRCYPGLFRYMRSMGWIEAGPIRETYLVSPAEVSDYGQLLTEVQLPVTFGR